MRDSKTNRPRELVLRVAVPNSRRLALMCIDVITPLLTEGDLDRGRPPALKSLHWCCGIVDPATGAACTLRPHTDGKHHQGRQAVQGAGRSCGARIWGCGFTCRFTSADSIMLRADTRW